jgi:hypothetical protein
MDRLLLSHSEEDWAKLLGIGSPFPVACLSLCIRHNTSLCARTGWVWRKALLGPPSSTTLKWFNGHIVSVPRANSRPPPRRRKMDGWTCNPPHSPCVSKQYFVLWNFKGVQNSHQRHSQHTHTEFTYMNKCKGYIWTHCMESFDYKGNSLFTFVFSHCLAMPGTDVMINTYFLNEYMNNYNYNHLFST